MKRTTTTTQPQENAFDELKRNFEKAYASGDYATELVNLSGAVAYSVVNKCLDPQRKTAIDRVEVSDNGQNTALLAIKRGIYFDRRLLDNTRDNASKATRATYNKDGDPVTITDNKDAYTALGDIIGDTLTDGMDMVQSAAVAILAQAAEHADPGEPWLDKQYSIRRLSRRVYIQLDDSAAYHDETTTPIQEVYREVRRAIQNSRAMQTDPRNGYTYIEDTTPDGLDTIFYRLGKWLDIGGYPQNGQYHNSIPGGPSGLGASAEFYTADAQTAGDYNELLERLNLTDRQAAIIRLRMQGKGYKAIATYLGVTDKAVKNTLVKIQRKAVSIGLTPAGHKLQMDE